MTATTQSQVVSAARFYLSFSNLGTIAFSELGGISSKVGAQEYIYNDDKGNTIHTKQFGKTEPPVIQLKRGLDAAGNTKLMAWHAMARIGDPKARGDGTLKVMDASGKEAITYVLHNAWCSEILISGLKAGDSAVATIECKVTCELIEVKP
ncbi:phage tail protein [Umezawaea tangerina]|uniref:Phage tail-like protein n=1 Tax=Umezawaea tangerina TaxID=84725 RepID=A0A2T0T081_9PSEU|nr:phage tail protein [Umezawaea tangerina]PRY39072.1 phage tail-like protein [Umezawaea tangerina]